MERKENGTGEVFDPTVQKVIQKKGSSAKRYDGISDWVCKRCGAKTTNFIKDGHAKRCGECKGTEFHEVMRFSSDAVTEVLNRQLLYVAIDGMEFTDKLACDAYNAYLIGNEVEADKCPRCGALYLVKNEDRKSCENCGLSSKEFRRGFLKKQIPKAQHNGILL